MDILQKIFDGKYDITPIADKKQQELDAAFLRIAEEVCGEGGAGSVFLIGDGFARDWMKDAVRSGTGSSRYWGWNLRTGSLIWRGSRRTGSASTTTGRAFSWECC